MNIKKDFSFYWLIFAGALALVIVSANGLVGNYQQLYRSGSLNYSLADNFRRPHNRPPSSEPLLVTDIRDWMTFEYLNKQFHLPEPYLKTQLEVTGVRYPRLTIKELAQDRHMLVSTMLAAVQNAVRNYIPPAQ